MSYEALKSVALLLALLLAGGVFLRRAYRWSWTKLRLGQPNPPFGQWGERIKGLLVYVAAQQRLFRVLLPGTAHFVVFWGFVVLSLTILQAIAEGLVAFADPHYLLPVIGRFGPLALVQDVATVLVTVAVLYGLYLRLVEDPERYRGSHKKQGVTVLLFIFAILLSLAAINGIRINLGEDPLAAWRPMARLLGLLFAGLDEGAQTAVEEIAYWIHVGVVLVFLSELPTGKHFHIITSLPAVLLRNLEPRGRLSAAPASAGQIGVGQVEQFRWRQMLDFYTCTECGRCQDVCPAYAGGQVLSPKLLMMDLRDHLKATGRNPGNAFLPGEAKPLVGNAVSEAALWACTSCYACDQECPLLIEHVSPIVDMRRGLVNEGKVAAQLQDALANLGRYGNSFGQSDRARAKWTMPIQPRIKDARKEPVEFLWFVGDYASYSSGVIEITQKTAEVFQQAGLDFGILYEGERNAGNDVRRVGEEGLFEMLAERNRAALDKCTYQSIVTTDPHSYNTLKNEYPANGGQPVLHYSELLDRLIAGGQIRLARRLGYKVRGRTYINFTSYALRELREDTVGRMV
jgi:Fe-S oxidoreductase